MAEKPHDKGHHDRQHANPLFSCHLVMKQIAGPVLSSQGSPTPSLPVIKQSALQNRDTHYLTNRCGHNPHNTPGGNEFLATQRARSVSGVFATRHAGWFLKAPRTFVKASPNCSRIN